MGVIMMRTVLVDDHSASAGIGPGTFNATCGPIWAAGRVWMEARDGWDC